VAAAMETHAINAAARRCRGADCVGNVPFPRRKLRYDNIHNNHSSHTVNLGNGSATVRLRRNYKLSEWISTAGG
jgi:hypothetical protein